MKSVPLSSLSDTDVMQRVEVRIDGAEKIPLGSLQSGMQLNL